MCSDAARAHSPIFNTIGKRNLNLIFVCGILLGAAVAATVLGNPNNMVIHPKLVTDLAAYNIHSGEGAGAC